MRHRRLLLVDDHALVRDSLLLLLEQRLPEVAVMGAGSLAEAVARAHQDPALDLALLDLDLPDSRGVETLARFRSSLPHLPVVVLSAHEARDQVLLAIDNGAAGYLGKSVDADALVHAIGQVVRGAVVLPHPVEPAVDIQLSGRQRDVLRLLLEGMSNKQICRELDITEATVKSHLQVAFRRLNVTSRTQAVVAVARLGLLI